MDSTEIMRTMRSRGIEIDIMDTRPIEEIALALGILTAIQHAPVPLPGAEELRQSGIISEDE